MLGSQAWAIRVRCDPEVCARLLIMTFLNHRRRRLSEAILPSFLPSLSSANLGEGQRG